MALSLHDWLDDLERRASARGQKGIAFTLRAISLTSEIGRQLVGDQALRTAAALAFTTILSMVPLMAVSFGIMKAIVPNEELAGRVRGWLLHSLLADSVGEVTGILDSFLERAQGGAIGLVGFVFLLVTALSLFLSIERAFNRIWRVPTSRPLHRRLVTFYSVITLAPALVGLGFVAVRWMQAGLDAMPFGFTLGAQFINFCLEVMALLLIYRLLPHAQVQWRVALLGAIWAATMIAASKWGFNTYIDSIYTGSVQSKIYGSFALIPVFFIWVYLAWIIVLGGVELAYMVQNRHALTRAMLHRRRGPDQRLVSPPTGYLVARVFFEIARRFRAQGGGLPLQTIAARLQIELDEVEPALRILRDGGLVLQVDGGEAHGELVPSRPLDQVTLRQLMALCDDIGYQPGELPVEGVEALEEHLVRARGAHRAALERSVASFLDAQVGVPWRSRSSGPPAAPRDEGPTPFPRAPGDERSTGAADGQSEAAGDPTPPASHTAS